MSISAMNLLLIIFVLKLKNLVLLYVKMRSVAEHLHFVYDTRKMILVAIVTMILR